MKYFKENIDGLQFQKGNNIFKINVKENEEIIVTWGKDNKVDYKLEKVLQLLNEGQWEVISENQTIENYEIF